jgi:hypothetical protein
MLMMDETPTAWHRHRGCMHWASFLIAGGLYSETALRKTRGKGDGVHEEKQVLGQNQSY